MPLYRFRLEGPDGYRTGTVSAESKDAAKEYLLRKEDRLTEFVLEPDALKAAEAAEKAEGVTPANVRADLAMHRQAKPYKLTKLEKA
jgi:hypothetical protein